MNCNNQNTDQNLKLNPLKWSGTSQPERFLASRLPDFVLVDERKPEDLLDFTVRLSEMVQYYDLSNEREGSWREFFEEDISFRLGSLLREPIANEAKLFRTLQAAAANSAFRLAEWYWYSTADEPEPTDGKQEAAGGGGAGSGSGDPGSTGTGSVGTGGNAVNTSIFWYDRNWKTDPPTDAELQETEAEMKRDFRELLELVFDMIRRLDDWSHLPGDQVGFGKMILGAIKSVLNEKVREFIIISRLAAERLGWAGGFSFYFLDKAWYEDWGTEGLGEADYPYFETAESDAHKIQRFLNPASGYEGSPLYKVFEVLYEESLRLQGQAVPFLEATMREYPEHLSHSSLLLAFFRLFRFQQNAMNGLTRNHLDHYYGQVLRLGRKPATPDMAHVLFSAAREGESFQLPAGTRLAAGKDANGVNLIYALDKEVVVTDAQVCDLKTIFISKPPGEDPNACADPLKDEIRYIWANPKADTADGLEEALPEDAPYWPALGESQINDAGQAKAPRTMQDALLGFSVASPLLWLEDGLRVVKFKFITTQEFHVFPLLGFNVPFRKAQFEAIKDRIIPGITLGWDWDNFLKAVEVLEKEPAQVKALVARVDDVMNAWAILLSGHAGSSTPGNFNKIFPDVERLYSALPTAWSTYQEKIRQAGLRLKESLKVSFSGEEGWFEVGDIELSFFEHDPFNVLSTQTIEISCTLHPDIPIVTFPGPDFEGDALGSPWPLAKFELNAGRVKPDRERFIGSGNFEQYWEGSLYEMLRLLHLAQLRLEVCVSDSKTAEVFTDAGEVDASKPFLPFGAVPRKGNGFSIRHREAFSKQLSRLDVKVEWLDPPASFEDHYQHYGKNQSPISNPTNVQAEVFPTYFNGLPMTMSASGVPQAPLFYFSNDIKADRTFSFSSLSTSAQGCGNILYPINFTYDYLGDLYDGTEGDKGAESEPDRMLRFELTGKAFLHSSFNRVYSQKILDISTSKLASPPSSETLPLEPYTPSIKSFSLNYVAEDCVEFDAKIAGSPPCSQDSDLIFMHLYPFGYEQQSGPFQLAPGIKKDLPLVPALTTPDIENTDLRRVPEGVAYIGLKGVRPPQQLSLLMQLEKGTNNPALPTPKLQWSYLSENGWDVIDPTELLDDTSLGLVTAGIVTLTIPSNAVSTHTLMPQGKFWLRVHAEENSESLPMLSLVSAQAGRVIFTNEGNDPVHSAVPLPSGTIKNLEQSDSRLRKIEQPKGSFDGQAPEYDEAYYQRVSERLRHKDRAIQIWDYEHLLLEEFPWLFKVLCLNHTHPKSGLYPGHIMLILVPRVDSAVDENRYKPRVSVDRLESVRRFIRRHIGPWVEVRVRNPEFEEIGITAEINLYEGRDPGFYKGQAVEDLKRLLSPWVYGAPAAFAFGGKLTRAQVIDFLEELEYVDYVSELSFRHRLPGNQLSEQLSGDVIASKPISILVTSDRHYIKIPGSKNDWERRKLTTGVSL